MAKRLLISTYLIALAAAVTAQAAAAQQPQTRADILKNVDQGFNRADTNNDGFLSRAEVAAVEARFVKEAQEKVDTQATIQFQKLDTDKNGQLSLSEFKSFAKVRPTQTPDQAVQRLDANKDGRVSAAEFKANTLAQFDRLDLNKDGTITADEAAKAKSR
jgi:Ca2+-binding EF-hand superfamily protein